MPYKDPEKRRECQRKCSKKWYLNNKDKHNAYQRSRRPRYFRKLRVQVYEAYGNKCACCGEATFEFLSIDHINGGGREHFKRRNAHGILTDIIREGFPKDKYRLLCMNCNWARSVYGACPHERNNK